MASEEKFQKPPTQAVTKGDVGHAIVAESGYTPAVLTMVKAFLPTDIVGNMGLVAAYIMTARRLGLDPINGGLYAYQSRGKLVAIIHYDAMVGIAERENLLKRYDAECVYPGEKFTFNSLAGTLEHEMDPTKRHGIPMGAWARVVRADGQIYMVFAAYDDYKNTNDVWKTYAADMNRKAAVRLVLERAFPGLYAGVYSEDEWDVKRNRFATQDAEDNFVRDDPPVVEVARADTAADLFGGER